jgi:hypothetical protein
MSISRSRLRIVFVVLALVVLALGLRARFSEEKEPYGAIPDGKPIGASSTACGTYLNRSDLQALLGDPTRLVQTKMLETPMFGTCGLYDSKAREYILRLDVTTELAEFDRGMKNGRSRPSAVLRSANSAAFMEGVGSGARALVRLPKASVVVVLRQGPMTPERLNLLLDIAEKIAATVPAPFGTAKPTPTDGTDGAGSTTGQSGRVNGS